MSTALISAAERLAICSWSLEPCNPQDLLTKLQLTGVKRLQLALDPLQLSPAVWDDAPDMFRRNGICLVSGMVGCIGEDYSTLESIRVSGGIAPDKTWEQNLRNFEKGADLACQLGLKLVTFHAGFLPHNPADPAFAQMMGRLRMVADIFAAREIMLGLETGQETAESLARVLSALAHPHVGVNFDPANMLLYDQGDPVTALHRLSPWLKQVHVKDATRTKVPGTWGTEVAVGAGDVRWPEFFTTLRSLNFTGNLVIEREAGNQRVIDICAARDLVLQHA